MGTFSTANISMRPDALFNNTLSLWFGSGGILAEECSALLSAVTLLLILVPMSQESDLCPKAEEGHIAC